MTIIVFILTILILVIIHELGHFVVAKRFGIKVLEFGFGIPPRIWGKKIGETLISINALPFGGFVRLLGEDEAVPIFGLTGGKGDQSQRYFSARPVGERILVVVAGVVMNLLLAWLLFYVVLIAQGFKTQFPLITDHHFIGVRQTNEEALIVESVNSSSPAKDAGIKIGDRVLALNGQPLTRSDALISQTKSLAGQEIRLTLSDEDKTNAHEIKLIPRKTPPANQGPLGISFGSLKIANLDYSAPTQMIFSGITQSYNLAAYSFEILGKTISVSFASHNLAPVSQTIAGPVGVTSLVGEILSTRNPLFPFLNFLAALSLNLAVVNILPFPGLDGGRLLFLVVEAVTKKKAHPVLERYIHTIGLVVLIGLVILITISDVKKLIF